ncbi:MAG TPA: DNA ligase D, partial [Chitinophagaceae bacterium]
ATGIAFFKTAQEASLEGIIAKKAGSRYTMNVRTKEWLKIKHQLNCEAVIVGYTEPRGGRKHFGALVLAQYDNDELQYIGHTGTGFNQQALKELWNKMQPLITSKSPFNKNIKVNMPVTWIKPKLVCQISFTEETADGRLRHPVFMGLRPDKNFKEVQKETEEPVNKKTVLKDAVASAPEKSKQTKTTAAKSAKGGNAKKESPQNKKSNTTKDNGDKTIVIEKRNLALTNLNKIYFPDEKITKGDLINYYDAIAPHILPYLKDRPLSLKRQPNGITDPGFFHKDAGEQAPSWVKKADVHSESGDKIIHYIMINDKPSLLYAANLGSIEMNPWNSTIKKMEYPTWMVIDIDPSDKNNFEEVIETALATQSVLKQAGADGYCKTSGATGLHVYVPMGNRYTYDQAKEFGEIIATLVQHQLPDTTSVIRSLQKRGNKIYVDFLQNRRGQTLAAAYSARPKAGATVSTPLEWKEVKPGLHPSQFTIKNILQRMEKKGDLFSNVLGKGIDLRKCLKNLGA